MQHIDTLKIFFTQLSMIELVKLRHNAIQINDMETKKLIDEEMKRRINK